MNVLGISCHYHDAAACLYRDGRIAAAAQEERFTRRKAAPEFPVRAINACLQSTGLTALDLDLIGFHEKPYLKFSRTVLSHLRAWPLSYGNFRRSMPEWLSTRLTLPLDIRRELAFEGRILFLKHHQAHAASAFLPSPFPEAAILTADGLGEWATTSFGVGRDTEIEIRRELCYPDSLGLFYTAVTTWLGFPALSGEGRVMALSDFGEPTRLDDLRKILEVKEDGSYRLDERYLPFVRGRRMFGRRFVRTFGPPRAPDEELSDRHRDVAASLQRHLEETLVAIARHVHRETGMTRLCAAGGVFLNCVANSRILEETPFEELFVQPAAGDAGAALGAAAFLSHCLEDRPRADPMTDAYLGPSFEDRTVRRALGGRGLEHRELPAAELAAAVAGLVAAGRVVGWFRGRMEFGPRALGARSILADPRDAGMKDRLNARVKHREPFRPYGVSILAERASEWFEISGESPFMLLVARAREGKRERIPAALHVDGTSRLQTLTPESNGLYRDVVAEFARRTGVPMVINTSMNDHGEPIVCSPEDALSCLERMELDALAIEGFLVAKDPAILEEAAVPAPEGGDG